VSERVSGREGVRPAEPAEAEAEGGCGCGCGCGAVCPWLVVVVVLCMYLQSGMNDFVTQM